MGSESEIASGKDESQNIKRRQARQQRRQLWRRGRRLKKVFHLLQKAGLLPAGSAKTPDERHQLINKLDAELAKEFIPEATVWPDTCCRTACVAWPSINHCLRLRLAGHCSIWPSDAGFLSNRKSAAKDDKEAGEVKAGIGDLYQKIEETNARTLGEYFSRLDPEEQRIRKRWTARQMYLDEFEKMWLAQAPHHSNLTDEWKTAHPRGHLPSTPVESRKRVWSGRASWNPIAAVRQGHRSKPSDSVTCRRSTTWKSHTPTAKSNASFRPATAMRKPDRMPSKPTPKSTFDRMRTILGLKTPKAPRRSTRST